MHMCIVFCFKIRHVEAVIFQSLLLRYLFVCINSMASVNLLPIRALFSRSTSFKWENIRSTDYCVQGKQLIIRDTGCTIRGYFEIMSQTFGNFNLPSCSTSTSTSANAVISDFADAVADASAAAVECKEFKYMSSQILMLLNFCLSQFLHHHLLFGLKCFEFAKN